MAGYGLARIPYRWSNVVLYATVATLLIPAAVTFVPSFVLVSTLGWVSSLRGLIVPGLFQALRDVPVPPVLPRLPAGAGGRRPHRRVGLLGHLLAGGGPELARASSPRSATITFIGSWNAFLWPLVIGQDQSSWTVQIALSTFLTQQTSNLHQLFIAAVISILPLLVMFLFLQRWIVQGVERSGINE